MIRACPPWFLPTSLPPMVRSCQVEFYTLQYATTVASMAPSAWTTAVQYLAWCPRHGAAATRALLESVPLTSQGIPDEQLALRVLRFCDLYGTPGQPLPCISGSCECAWRGQQCVCTAPIETKGLGMLPSLGDSLHSNALHKLDRPEKGLALLFSCAFSLHGQYGHHWFLP